MQFLVSNLAKENIQPFYQRFFVKQYASTQFADRAIQKFIFGKIIKIINNLLKLKILSAKSDLMHKLKRNAPSWISGGSNTGIARKTRIRGGKILLIPENTNFPPYCST